jgi:hypothetical protein
VHGANAREPTPIKACGTISQPGSYEPANNLAATPPSDCLVITANFVTIDLAGFLIGGSGLGAGAGIKAPQGGTGIALRNASISGFGIAVDLSSANGSVVEGLRVSGDGARGFGITATGIVKDNTVTGVRFTGITATGTVTGNYASRNGLAGFDIGPGSTVIGNTATNNSVYRFAVSCPSNLTDNTAVNNTGIGNLVLNGEGCHNEDNLAP